MKKFWTIVSAAYQNGLSYPGAVFIKVGVDIAFAVTMIVLWVALFRQHSEIGGYTLRTIITYYILIRLADLFYSFYAARLISRQIRTGDIANFLCKPVSYFTYAAAYTLGAKAARSVITLILALIFFAIFQNLVVLPPSVYDFATFIMFGLISWAIYYELAFLIGILAFWISETGNLQSGAAQIIALFSGGWLPITFFPEAVTKVINYLPIKFLYYFMVQLFQGKVARQELPLDLSTAMVWIIVLGIFCKVGLEKGLARYEVFGR